MEKRSGSDGTGGPGRQRQLGEESRERLLDAAAIVFADRGVHQSSLQAIGEQAGISRGSIVHHFKSKQALLVAVVERTYLAWSDDVDSADVGPRTGLPALMAVIDAHERFVRERPADNRLYYSLASDVSSDPALLARVRDMHHLGFERSCRYILDGIRDGSIAPDIDPEISSRLLYSMLAGIGHQHVLMPEVDLAPVYDELRELVTVSLKP